MTETSISGQVCALIAEQLGIDRKGVVPEASFADDLGVDSMDAVELIMALEEAYGIEIPDQEAERLQRVGEVIQYLQGRGVSGAIPKPEET